MWQKVLVFITCCSLVPVSSQTTSPVPSLQTPIPPEKDVFRCEPITIDICMDVGYNNASFPNFRLHETRAEANAELQNFWPLIRAQCSNAIVHMLCAVYAPFCSPQFPNIRVRPCRNLCMHVRDGCEARLREFGFTWPPHLDCSQYSNESLCFGPPDPSEVEIPQSVLNQLGVTRAPDISTPGPSPTGSVLLNVTDQTPVGGCDPGMYLATNGTCLPCPVNSNSTQSGTSVCPCFEGYYRAIGDPPEMGCTQPPSAPHNLKVLQVTNTTVQLSWDPPVSIGGRDDLEYQLSYQIATSSEPVTIYGRVNMTEGQITGLRPFTQYVVFVSSENGVFAQDTGTSGRTVSVNITTLEGVPSTILSTAFQVNEVDEIVTWQPPAQPNGMIRYYNIRISHVDGTGKEFVVTGVTETTYDFSALGLSMGVYIIQIQAVTGAGAGQYSTPVALIIDDGSESPAGSQSHIALVAICCTLAVITAVLFVIVLCTCIHLRTKLGHTATDRPEYATPDSPPTSNHSQAANTKENVYEIGGQPMCAELNAKEHDTPM